MWPDSHMRIVLDSQMLSQGTSTIGPIVVVGALQFRVPGVHADRTRHARVAPLCAGALYTMKSGAYAHVPPAIDKCFARTRGRTRTIASFTQIGRRNCDRQGNG